MATLWSKISAVLPLSEEDFPLQFSDRVEPSVVEMLKRSRQLLYRQTTGSSRMLQAQIILDYSWEKLNTGTWRHVDKDWRRVYSYGCLFKVAALCHRDPSADDVLQAVRTCDMALLMGAAIMDDILQVIVQILQREVRKSSHDKDEGEHSEVKVGGLFISLTSFLYWYVLSHSCIFSSSPAAFAVFIPLRWSALAGVPSVRTSVSTQTHPLVSNCCVIPGLAPRLCLKRPSISAGVCRITVPWNSSSL